MKVSTAALVFLILAVSLVSWNWAILETREVLEACHQHEPQMMYLDFYQPVDCCNAYTSWKIRCSNMKGYFEASSGCSRSAIIFLSKKGHCLCANPRDPSVQHCVKKLSGTSEIWGNCKI